MYEKSRKDLSRSWVNFLSFNYAFAEQNKVASNSSIAMMNVKAELIKYNKDRRPSRLEGDKHVIYGTNEVSFRVAEPSKYAGREIIIESFCREEFDSYRSFESKKTVYYSFDIPNDFF